MGICLDTAQQNGSQVFEGQQPHGRDPWMHGDTRFPGSPRANGAAPGLGGAGLVKFEAPKVPVIFVLGGPGSGKVTHCDNLMHEKRGVAHINMTDLLQQYAIGNADMKDFSQLSSQTVTEVLMLEMKMAPAAKTYLVSGYPRSMRDVVEYSEKIQVVSGVVLVSWRQKVLERQIEFGAKLGHVVLSLARMELGNFYKNVMPVADYFDQRGMLYAVNGERDPAEVYKDFRSAVLRILGARDPPPPPPPPPPPRVAADVTVEAEDPPPVQPPPAPPPPKAEADPGYKAPAKGFPPVIWVIGGPGSNKSSLCQKVVRQCPGWVHCSVGRLLRAATDSTDHSQSSDSQLVRRAISTGEMVPQTCVLQLVESQMRTNMSAQGILMDGFPRDINQVTEFENKFRQTPSVILLDCSKLQLGRGRPDDSVAAFRRRLEQFRELSLPMLKALDAESRLTIVDGDTDAPAVQAEFSRAVLAQVAQLKRTGGLIMPQHAVKPSAALRDPEDEDEPAPRANGFAGGHLVHPGQLGQLGQLANGAAPRLPAVAADVPETPAGGRLSRETIRDMYAHLETYPVDPQL
ncbi:adenylate kinase isoenzyme 5 [Bacillus rossius redtenbacheri]|uniref:adenylate kinase isoenzyme 5 n=1 Tax=Bacillus rossius redtenbacheri TaxID=93214 RepID=UPI002FDE121A